MIAIKVVESALLCAWFCLLAAIALWIMWRGKVGHKRLLWTSVLFTMSMAVYQLTVAWDVYSHGKNYDVTARGFAACCGGILALYAWRERFNLCKTFVVSETKDVARKEAAIDAQHHENFKFELQIMAADMLLESSRNLIQSSK